MALGLGAALALGGTAAAGSVLGSMVQASSSKKFMNHQANLNKQLAKYYGTHQYQWAMEDLEKAGLNPILAAGSAGRSGTAGGVGLQQAPDYSKSITSAIETYMAVNQGELMGAQTQQAKATAAKELAAAANINAQTEKTKTETGGTVPALVNEVKGLGESIGEWTANKVISAKEGLAKHRAYQNREYKKRKADPNYASADLAGALFN